MVRRAYFFMIVAALALMLVMFQGCGALNTPPFMQGVAVYKLVDYYRQPKPEVLEEYKVYQMKDKGIFTKEEL